MGLSWYRVLGISRVVLYVTLLGSSSVLARAHDKPAPAEKLSYAFNGSTIRLTWEMPGQAFGVRYYLDVCRLERSGWLRIFGTYVNRPPFALQHPRPRSAYAWRVLSVDADEERNFTPTAWVVLRTPASLPPT